MKNHPPIFILVPLIVFACYLGWSLATDSVRVRAIEEPIGVILVSEGEGAQATGGTSSPLRLGVTRKLASTGSRDHPAKRA